MIKKFLFFALVLIYSTTLHAQSPYGKVLTLDNSGAQQWIDIGTVLSNYITYHVGSNSPAWLTNGNAITSSAKFGSTNNQSILIITDNTDRFRLTTKGQIEVLNSGQSVFIGEGAGNNQDNTMSRNSVFIGWETGYHNISGMSNTAIGYRALYTNSSGHYNTASGVGALYSNNGSYNTAFGFYSIFSNTTGTSNTAVGYQALKDNTTGSQNTALGMNSLYYNTTGEYNSAVGSFSLYNNTTGSRNAVLGDESMNNNISGSYNTAVGYQAGYFITTGSNNICIGYNAQVPSVSSDNQIRIGNTSITYAGVEVAWTITSDYRLKENISNSKLGLEFINKLRPVSYTRRNDKTQKLELGFIAQEVEKVLKEEQIENTGLVSIADDGTYSLRYNDFIAPIVKSIQELTRQNEALKAENEQMRTENEQMRAENEALKQRLERLEKYVFERTGSGDNNVGMK